MQISDAIERWVDEHRNGLSASTVSDIDDIALAVLRLGYDDFDCAEIGEPERLDIIAETHTASALSATAIGQFLTIVVDWGSDLPATLFGYLDSADLRSLPSDSDTWVEPTDDTELLAPTDITWLDEEPEPDEDLPGAGDPGDARDAETTEDDSFDDDSFDDDSFDDSFDDDEIELVDDTPGALDESGADEVDTAVDEDNFDPDELELIDTDLTTTDEDDFDPDELELIDTDLTTTDEDDFDPDELELIDTDLTARVDDVEDSAPDTSAPSSSTPDNSAPSNSDPDDSDLGERAPEDIVVVVGEAGTPPLTGPANQAASSFLRTLDRSTTAPEPVFGNLTASAAPVEQFDVPKAPSESGVFSEAAQSDGRRAIDWITVAYFVVAAICFAFVIYFYLSG
ncbi:MAG: hypothetical protein AAF567_18085 [Actinomycetota bacterium]